MEPLIDVIIVGGGPAGLAVPGLYLAGAIISGKETNRIFIENGRLHGETIIQHIRTSGIG